MCVMAVVICSYWWRALKCLRIFIFDISSFIMLSQKYLIRFCSKKIKLVFYLKFKNLCGNAQIYRSPGSKLFILLISIGLISSVMPVIKSIFCKENMLRNKIPSHLAWYHNSWRTNFKISLSVRCNSRIV